MPRVATLLLPGTDLSLPGPAWLWAAALALAVLGLLLRLARRSADRGVQTDPQRMFDGPQRAEGRRRAGGRCEHKPMLGRRCSGLAAQADHIYPWSRGGATSMGNLQYLCERCNATKSDRVPGRLYIWRLERRRRRYFPADAPVRVAWRFGEVPARS